MAAGCTAALPQPVAPTAAAATSASPGDWSQLTPLVDHHQHLLSPAAAEFVSRQPLPAVEVPAELAQLLEERARRWNDSAALAGVFAEDALVFDNRIPGWIQGRHAVASSLASFFGWKYRITPAAYDVDDSGGFVSGYYTRGEEDSIRHIGHVTLAVARDSAGNWRIASETPAFPGPTQQEPVTAEELVARLDAAGIRRAVVLSTAYYFDSVDPRGRPPLPDEHARVRVENDWTAEQVAGFPDRLVAFCGFNVLKDYAVSELERCARNPHLLGVKLHFNGAQVDLNNAEHVERVRRVFQAANDLRMPIIAHVSPGEKYGPEFAEIFLSRVLPAAPDVTVQIAHLWGGDSFSDPALAVYANAISAGDSRARNLYFDVSDVWSWGSEEERQLIARRIRQIGLGRILYGSDGVPRRSWAAFRTEIPLTNEEFRAIAQNVAPYMR